MCPLPFLSGLFHGCVETGTDITMDGSVLKDKGYFFGTAVETVNALAAIKQTVFIKKEYSLRQIYKACENNFAENEIMRQKLWNVPKWGNNDDFVDSLGKELLEFCCREVRKFKTVSGGSHLAGIHQPHPVPTGRDLMATPEGRKKGMPVAVTLTPESGTAEKGPTAILQSAAKINYLAYQWNFCVMVNYFSSTFSEGGADTLECLIRTYFRIGGTQHQPNIADVKALRAAQKNPEQYQDLIVRLWGVSAHFVNLPAELQEELISRFS